jgi:hypothetical protein
MVCNNSNLGRQEIRKNEEVTFTTRKPQKVWLSHVVLITTYSLWLLGTSMWPNYSLDYRDRLATLVTNGQFSMPLQHEMYISY